jgi:hypothetical protein
MSLKDRRFEGKSYQNQRRTSDCLLQYWQARIFYVLFTSILFVVVHCEISCIATHEKCINSYNLRCFLYGIKNVSEERILFLTIKISVSKHIGATQRHLTKLLFHICFCIHRIHSYTLTYFVLK